MRQILVTRKKCEVLYLCLELKAVFHNPETKSPTTSHQIGLLRAHDSC